MKSSIELAKIEGPYSSFKEFSNLTGGMRSCQLRDMTGKPSEKK
jgi:hypothetical protein